MELSRAAFDSLRREIRRLCGIVLSEDKEYLVRHRLEPVVRLAGCRGFQEFCERLAQGGSVHLREAVIEAITTQETSFFRDHHPFDALRRQILPDLWRTATPGGSRVRGPIRIWCAATATGQEAYSLAILILELAAGRSVPGARPEDFSILATDISARALATAKAGAYERRQLERGLTPAQIHHYFEHCGEHWVARPALRKLVEFRRVNLVEPFPGLGTFDLILCRNVLIYFHEDARRSICGRFFEMLPIGGWLLLGSAENLYGVRGQFTSVHLGDTMTYRKSPP